VGWFAGSNASGTAVRTTLAGGLANAGVLLADGPIGGAGRWVAANAKWLRVAVGVLGAVVLLWGNDVSLPRLFWSLLLVVVLLGVVQVLVGAGRDAGAFSPVPGAATSDPQDTVTDVAGVPGGGP